MIDELCTEQKVTVKKDFHHLRFKDPDDPGVNSEMLKYAGTVLTIKGKRNINGWYCVEENCWTWDSRWFIIDEVEFKPVNENDILNLLDI